MSRRGRLIWTETSSPLRRKRQTARVGRAGWVEPMCSMRKIARLEEQAATAVCSVCGCRGALLTRYGENDGRKYRPGRGGRARSAAGHSPPSPPPLARVGQLLAQCPTGLHAVRLRMKCGGPRGLCLGLTLRQNVPRARANQQCQWCDFCSCWKSAMASASADSRPSPSARAALKVASSIWPLNLSRIAWRLQ
jgi:hypothetical protein